MNITIPKGFFRFSGISLLLGGAMGAIGQVLHLEDTPDTVADIPHWLPMAVNLHVLLAWGSTLILMGLPGLFLRQASGLKKWGWAALPLLFIGLMFEIFHGPVQIMAYPYIFDHIRSDAELQTFADYLNDMAIDRFPLQLAVMIPIMPGVFLGMLMTGIAILKAKVLPKGPGIGLLVVFGLLIAGMFIHVHILEISFSYLHLMFLWLGAILAFEKQGEAKAATVSGAAQV